MESTLTQNEIKANERIRNAVTILSLFLSGQNEDIDQADMNNLINQSDYKAITVPAGVYTLSFHSGNNAIELPSYAVPTVARSLRVGDEELDFNLKVLHHKPGRILAEEAIAIIKGKSPVHIVASNGLLKEEVRKLTEANKASAKKQADLKNCNLDSAEHSSYDEELGMDF